MLRITIVKPAGNLKPSMAGLLLMVFLLLPMTAVAIDKKPSDSTIKELVTKDLYEDYGDKEMGSFGKFSSCHKLIEYASTTNANNFKIESVKIVKLGNFNKDGHYWPVKVSVRGTCDIWAPR